MTRSRRIRLQALRIVIFALAAAFFLVPIGAMFEFSTRGIGINSARTFSAWAAIPSTPELATAITVSLELALITSLLMLGLLLPTMVWVRLRLPRLNRIVEFICLMPLTVPAIALVVGIKPLYIWISLNFTDSILALSFAYLILVLPYAYRSLDAGLAAIDLKILTEAARSLGAEYTFANLLNYENLQVAIQYVSLVSAGTSIAVAVASLLFAFVLLMILSFAGSRRRRGGPVAPVATPIGSVPTVPPSLLAEGSR